MKSTLVLLLVILTLTIVSIANINIVEDKEQKATSDDGVLKFYQEYDKRTLLGETICDPYVYKGVEHYVYEESQ